MRVLATPWKVVESDFNDAEAVFNRQVRFLKHREPPHRKWWEVKVIRVKTGASDTVEMTVDDGSSITQGLKNALGLTELPMPPDLEIGFLAGFCTREMWQIQDNFDQLKVR